MEVVADQVDAIGGGIVGSGSESAAISGADGASVWDERWDRCVHARVRVCVCRIRSDGTFDCTTFANHTTPSHHTLTPIRTPPLIPRPRRCWTLFLGSFCLEAPTPTVQQVGLGGGGGGGVWALARECARVCANV